VVLLMILRHGGLLVSNTVSSESKEREHTGEMPKHHTLLVYFADSLPLHFTQLKMWQCSGWFFWVEVQ